MHTLTLKVQDSVLDKVLYFLKNLPKQEVIIVSDQIEKENDVDLIGNLVNNPIHIGKEINFLSRDDANER